MLQNIQLSDLLLVGPRIVGLTFLWAGGIKATAPHTFQRHLSTLGWIPRTLVAPAVTLSAGFETGLGIALIVGASYGVLLPATVLILVILSMLSWWGVKSGNATDCGCYGGFIQPSISQSIGLNALFSFLCMLAWMRSRDDYSIRIWQVIAIAALTIMVSVFTYIAQRHATRTGQPLIDLNPLKAGNKWKHSWTHGATARIEGEVLVAFLGPDCPHCSNFVKVGNAMVQSPKLPRVIGVVATSKERLSTFIKDKGIRFPTINVSQSLMARMVSAVPTVAVVESGRIKRVWIGDVPPDVVDRIKFAFFPSPPDRSGVVAARS
jgi:hypothetical protein